MGSIDPVGAGGVAQPMSIAQRATRPIDVARPDATRGALQLAGIIGAETTSGSDGLLEAIVGLFETIDSALENDDLLQAIVALLILMAVLEMLQPSEEGGSNSAGAESGGQMSSLFAYSSSTTITIEQSSSVIAIGNADELASLFGDGSSPSMGSQVDLLA